MAPSGSERSTPSLSSGRMPVPVPLVGPAFSAHLSRRGLLNPHQKSPKTVPEAGRAFSLLASGSGASPAASGRSLQTGSLKRLVGPAVAAHLVRCGLLSPESSYLESSPPGSAPRTKVHEQAKRRKASCRSADESGTERRSSGCASSAMTTADRTERCLRTCCLSPKPGALM